MLASITEIQGAMAAMSDDPCNRSRLYLTDRELAALPCMAHDTAFAVTPGYAHAILPCSKKEPKANQDCM